MTVHLTVEGRRATIRLDRPEVHNALDRATLDGITDAFRQVARDSRIGCVVLTGTGDKAFCTGADLAEQKAFLERPNDYWEWMGHFIDMIDAIRDCPVPVIARLNGIVVGGGNEINLACDLAVAADDIYIRHVGPSRGSLPAGGATQWMPIFVGDRRAREVMLLNREIPIATAYEWGWVNRVVPRTELDAAVDDLCGELLRKMPEILRATKAELNFWKDLSWSLTIRMAREWLTVHAASAEVREGLRSFDAKVPPDWEGLRRAIDEAGGGAPMTDEVVRQPAPDAQAEADVDPALHPPAAESVPTPGEVSTLEGGPPEPGEGPTSAEIYDE